MKANRNNLDLAIVILDTLIDKGLVEAPKSGEYTDREWDIQDTIEDILNKNLPKNK